MNWNKDQVVSAVTSGLKILGSILLTHGATKAAAIVNSEDVIGLIVTVVTVYFSHKYNETPK
jgi:hypothetical protein